MNVFALAIFILNIYFTHGYFYDKGMLYSSFKGFKLRFRKWIHDFNSGPVQTLTKCPGLYCGRHLIENGNGTNIWSACGSCPIGSRVNESSACSDCNSSPTIYDWMYLGFMVLVGKIFSMV